VVFVNKFEKDGFFQEKVIYLFFSLVKEFVPLHSLNKGTPLLLKGLLLCPRIERVL
jgi:hypothetical protein